jgi:multicomponent K+:H+ antiporter subunit E
MLRRILPYPWMTLVLTVVWVLLMNELSPGHVVSGFILGLIVPPLTAAYWPDRPAFRHPFRAAAYVLLVLWDIVIANIAVARIVLFKPNADLRPAWITIPLEITSPEAITLLAGTITMTPGTVSTDIAADRRSILVHCLHAPDPAATVATIKTRYERRVKEFLT